MNNTLYVLYYVINGGNKIICKSTNYTYIKRKKDVYDLFYGIDGRIKKLRKP